MELRATCTSLELRHLEQQTMAALELAGLAEDLKKSLEAELAEIRAEQRRRALYTNRIRSQQAN